MKLSVTLGDDELRTFRTAAIQEFERRVAELEQAIEDVCKKLPKINSPADCPGPHNLRAFIGAVEDVADHRKHLLEAIGNTGEKFDELKCEMELLQKLQIRS